MDERDTKLLTLPAYTGDFLFIYYLGLGSFLSMDYLGSFLSISYSYLGFPYWYDNQYINPEFHH
jgi:hypothetical protein